MVARPVKAEETASNPEARVAMVLEYGHLRSLNKTWEEEEVEEWSDVREAARRFGQGCHVGVVFGMFVEKGSGIPKKGVSTGGSKGVVCFAATGSG